MFAVPTEPVSIEEFADVLEQAHIHYYESGSSYDTDLETYVQNSIEFIENLIPVSILEF